MKLLLSYIALVLGLVPLSIQPPALAVPNLNPVILAQASEVKSQKKNYWWLRR